jgi:FMN phosphatase YigB (HAD superfamily)
MDAQAPVVFLIDVDNTLLDNDRVQSDLHRHLREVLGLEPEHRYFEILEERRKALGYVDYLGTLEQYRDEHPGDPHILGMSPFLLDYPFADRLYPGSLDLLRKWRELGTVAILSDGDIVFQPRKVERSGLWRAVDGNVLIYVHKEQMLEDVAARYPARHYIMVDDKLRILQAMKNAWETRLTSVFVRQGHYALDEQLNAGVRPADLTVETIAALLNVPFKDLLPSDQR